MVAQRQRILIIIAVISFLSVGAALVSQYMFDTPPCAWCVLQRLIYLVIGVVALIGAVGGAIVERIASVLSAVLAVSGIATAWYQHSVAAKMLSCDQTFADRFISHSGLDASVPFLFGIYASCMDAVVHFLGIEYSIWSLMIFVVIVVLGLLALRRAH